MQISGVKHINTSLLKNIFPAKLTTADRGVPYGGTIDSFINSGGVFELIIYEAFLERGVVLPRYFSFQTGYGIGTFPLTKDDDQLGDRVTDVYFEN